MSIENFGGHEHPSCIHVHHKFWINMLNVKNFKRKSVYLDRKFGRT